MKNLHHLHFGAVIVAIVLAACSSISGSPDTTLPPDGGNGGGVVWRPIAPEGDLPTEGQIVAGGTVVGVDGNRLTIGFTMGVDTCYGVESVEVTETDTTVSVDITVAARDADQVCIMVAENRSITVDLQSLLGERAVDVGGVPATL